MNNPRKSLSVSPRITNIWSQIRKFMRCASPQIANPRICNYFSANRKSANSLGVPVRKFQIRIFARKKAMFLILTSVLLSYWHCCQCQVKLGLFGQISQTY